MRILLALCLAVCGFAFADEAESFCSMELASTFKVLSADRGESAKQALLEAIRDEVKPKAKTFAEYVALLEEKVDWRDGKARLVSTLQGVIRDAKGEPASKKALAAEITEHSIVSFSDYLNAFGDKAEPSLCGADALMPGGVAFPLRGKKVFAFCPGSLLRASVVLDSKGARWADGVQLDALYFTAFHEMGHLLGADNASRFRSLHDGLMQCLNSSTVPFPKAQEGEVLADFWGAVALTAALKERPSLSTPEQIDLVALNLSALKNGSFGSLYHPPFGARQQVVLGYVCKKLLNQPGPACELNL